METDRRPEGVDDATVEAVGKLGEALEWVERARGRLYDFHQLSGHADQLLAGRRHVYESEMKDTRRSAGARHHERRPTRGS